MIPARTMTPEDFLSGMDNSELPFGETLGQAFVGGVNQSFGLGTALRDLSTPPLAEAPGGIAQRGGAARYLSPEEVAATGDTLYSTPDEYKSSPYFRDNVPFERGLTASRAKALADASDLASAREYWSSKRPITAFAGSLLGQAVDPLNYIPIFQEVELPAALGRVGAGAVRGSLEAATNTALFGALTAPERARLGYDTSWITLAQQVGFASMAGAVFGGLHGYWDRTPMPETQANRTKAAIVLNDAIDKQLKDGTISLGENSKAIIDNALAEARPVERTPVSVEERNGQLWFEGPKSELGVPSGQVSAVERNNVLQITSSKVRPELQGQGIGTDLYRQAIDYALSNGKSIESAPSISEAAAAVYDRLGREGYQVEKNPNVTQVQRPDGVHTVSENFKQPVYTVKAAPPQTEFRPTPNEVKVNGEPRLTNGVPEKVSQAVKTRPELSYALTQPPGMALEQSAKDIPAAEARVTAKGDPSQIAIKNAKGEGVDAETGAHDLEPKVQQLRDQGLLTAKDEEVLSAEDENFAATKTFSDMMQVGSRCVE